MVCLANRRSPCTMSDWTPEQIAVATTALARLQDDALGFRARPCLLAIAEHALALRRKRQHALGLVERREVVQEDEQDGDALVPQRRDQAEQPLEHRRADRRGHETDDQRVEHHQRPDRDVGHTERPSVVHAVEPRQRREAERE